VYEYSPFGEVIRASGAQAKRNPIRFSTKLQDPDSDLYYYGYRFLNPATGRWINRDPIEEEGGVNIYQMIANNPIGGIDPVGLDYGWPVVAPPGYPPTLFPPRSPTTPPQKPTFAVGLIPVVGSSLNAEYNFSQGNYWWGTFYSGLAVTDVFLVRSIATGFGKGCWKVGSHSWSATRAWFGRTRSIPPNAEVHHWLLQQDQGLGRWFPEWFKNQPWNLVIIDEGVVHGGKYSSKIIHLAIHGKSRRLTLNWVERAIYGTPGWVQWAALNFTLRATTVFEPDCSCSDTDQNIPDGDYVYRMD
jgi:RHS repeat-associated protein